MRRQLLLALLVLLVLVGAPAAAFGQGAKDTPPATVACPAPPARNPTGKGMMKLAECNAAAGRVATAWRQFRIAANAAGRDFTTAQAAQNRADAMIKLLPRLTVAVPTDTPLTVTIDGTDLPPEQWGAPVAIDPGPHVIETSTEDGLVAQVTVQIKIRENKTVQVEKPTQRAATAKAPPDGTPPTGTDTHVPPAGGTSSPETPPPAKGPGKAPLETLDPVAYDHARAPHYAAVHADHPPVIDGVLDDPTWAAAPKDASFFLETSKPYGLPSDEPTVVQVAYDAEYLYVAANLQYAKPHEPSDTPPFTEQDLREYFGVYVDPRHDHSGERVFALTPDGYRSEWEVWNNGVDSNFEWTGLWEGRTTRSAKGWSAEFRIPWGTLGTTPGTGIREMGINFRRSIAQASVMSWSLSPPGSPRPLPSFAGHLTGIGTIDRTQVLTLVPYIAAGWANRPSYRDAPPASWLRNLNGRASPFSTYAGMYGRAQLSHGLGADFMVNPDFSQVTPDAAIANLDRFELFFPEVREFFVNVAPTYAFGPSRYQLFYSRRIGLRKRIFGFDEVPILFGVNASIRRGGTNISVLEVYNDELPGPYELGRDTTVFGSHTVVARALQVSGGSRLGLMLLDQTQPFSLAAYRAVGTDGVLALYKNHLVLSGFAAYSNKQEIIRGLVGPIVTGNEEYHHVSDVAWQAAASFKTQEFEMNASYTDVGRDFRADLGFFERTGVHRSDLGAFYRPQVHSDLVRTATIGLQLSQLDDQNAIDKDKPIFSRMQILMQTKLLDAGTLSFDVSQNTDTVSSTFYVANNRIGIVPGTYTGNVATGSFMSATGARFQVGATYIDGYYFGGHQRLITPSLTVHLAKLGAKLEYQHYRLNAGATAISGDSRVVDGDRISARVLYAYSPDIRVTAAVEANTLDPVAVTQLVGSWRLDGLSSLTAVVNRSAPGTSAYQREASNTILLKFAYGVTAP